MSAESAVRENETVEVGESTASNVSVALVHGSLALAVDSQPEVPVEPEEQGGRRRRRSHARAKTISIRRLSKAEINLGRKLYPEQDYWKPVSRGQCAQMERPCPFVSCKYHLYLDVHPVRGSIKVNFPDQEVWEMTESCALDVADRGGITLEEVGVIMNLTRERVRQLETLGLSKMKTNEDICKLAEYLG
ncbi:MAG: DNA-binding protein [Deltaproteobacteria bacterium]|nr:DNA-binding protein [Deltaproteobacteria bacterium]